MKQIPDHPIIRNLEHTGCPNGQEVVYPICPVCGAECEVYYRDKDRDVVGCEGCVSAVDAWGV